MAVSIAVALLMIIPLRPPVEAWMPLSSPARVEVLLLMAQQVSGELRISGQYERTDLDAQDFSSTAKEACGYFDTESEWEPVQVGAAGVNDVYLCAGMSALHNIYEATKNSDAP